MVSKILVPTKYRDLMRKDVDIHAVQTVFAADTVTFLKFPTSHSIPLVKIGKLGLTDPFGSALQRSLMNMS